MIRAHPYPSGEPVHIRRLMVPALIPTAFLLGTFVNTGFTQQAANPPIVEVACMKVEPGKNAEYLALEHDIWKPMHQERIKQGRMRFNPPCTTASRISCTEVGLSLSKMSSR